ncbi:DNA cytosine methyltransferase [Varunaivibrio sulfuroxidans]|uniref:DNA (cytosine-5-)-methyltransferase n=1 Tax=Varunaivibrio sulfuroxidans TaxID=1773489 RepID=A0A4V2UP62_9PROT|nr:DNA cytosine methyltransferase [Varunaivibrio sulfuroxidans]TCS64681.1 DNA (cytosine-5)-methyltransferase 1 [Varunaivibrio sulfuroxidans]WES30012.1 DNA cytosine methyltransferase [Varunaivibrio sulfuroxidans]
MKLTAVDLFCGAGGLSEGFRQAGFDVLVGVDSDPYAIQTFKVTHPGAVGICRDIEQVSASQLMEKTGLKQGELTCLVGGPPCQAFSVYNHQRGMHDDRSGLFRHYLRIVQELRPEWVVMENVLGITSAGNGQAVQEIKSELYKLGYDVDTSILKAEDFGVPQERRRIFFVGNRINSPIPEFVPTFGVNDDKPFVTVWDAISDLPTIGNGEDAGASKYRTQATNEFQREMRGNAKTVTCHVAPKLGQINLDRMKHIPEGGSWRDIPFDLLPAGMKRAKRSDHTKRYGRLVKTGLSSTILTKCDLHWSACIHPNQDRTLTVREAARLQSFPDLYVFEGPRTEQYVQVGNAVPPRLARHVAEEILRVASYSADSQIDEPVKLTLVK